MKLLMIGYETRVVIKEGQEPGSLTTISATVKTPTDGNGPGIFMEIKRYGYKMDTSRI